MALFLNEMELSGSDSSSSEHGLRICSRCSPADGRTRIGVKVQDGCDNACTYCIVHVARGRATSRPANEVVAEAVALARIRRARDRAHRHQPGLLRRRRPDLADLCRRLLTSHRRPTRPGRASLPLPHRLRRAHGRDRATSSRSSPRPRAASAAILHLPLQSGSSRVLREMARPYDADEYRQLVDYLRASVPYIALTTDIIVGFPGETDDDFEDTCDARAPRRLLEDPRVPYSRREGTPAAERTDQVPPEAKADRAARLRALSDELAAADRACARGTIELALVETPRSRPPPRATTRQRCRRAPSWARS